MSQNFYVRQETYIFTSNFRKSFHPDCRSCFLCFVYYIRNNKYGSSIFITKMRSKWGSWYKFDIILLFIRKYAYGGGGGGEALVWTGPVSKLESRKNKHSRINLFCAPDHHFESFEKLFNFVFCWTVSNRAANKTRKNSIGPWAFSLFTFETTSQLFLIHDIRTVE